MSESNIPNLRTRAQAIKNETVKRANTAVRVGSLIEDFVDTIPAVVDGQWEFYLDSNATLANKLLITGGTKHQITIDGVSASLFSDTGITKLWNTTTNKIEPISGESFIFARFAIHAESVGASVNYFDTYLEVSGSSFPKIWEETGSLVKGAGIDQAFNFNMFLFIGDDFFANGGTIYIEPLNNILIHELAITIYRSYVNYQR